jgi:hypothetical protein
MSNRKSHSSRRGSQLRQSESEKRHSARNKVLIRDVLLGWQENGSMTESAASLEDVSVHGCLLRCSKRPVPRSGDGILFKVPGIEFSEWVPGILIEVKKPFLSDCLVRIRFLEPLSYATFKHLINGPEPEWVRKNKALEQELDRWWK